MMINFKDIRNTNVFLLRISFCTAKLKTFVYIVGHVLYNIQILLISQVQSYNLLIICHEFHQRKKTYVCVLKQIILVKFDIKNRLFLMISIVASTKKTVYSIFVMLCYVVMLSNKSVDSFKIYLHNEIFLLHSGSC